MPYDIIESCYDHKYVRMPRKKKKKENNEKKKKVKKNERKRKEYSK